jgi:hypothetical protein
VAGLIVRLMRRKQELPFSFESKEMNDDESELYRAGREAKLGIALALARWDWI